MNTSVCCVLVFLGVFIPQTSAANTNDCSESTLGEVCGKSNEKLCMWNRENCDSTMNSCKVVCNPNPCAGIDENGECGSDKTCQKSQKDCTINENGCRLVCKPKPEMEIQSGCCFNESIAAHKTGIIMDLNMTSEFCADYCTNYDALLFGMCNYHCVCFTEVNDQFKSTDDMCYIPCAGDETQKCGGSDNQADVIYVSVYKY